MKKWLVLKMVTPVDMKGKVKIDHGLLGLFFNPKTSSEGLCSMCKTHKKAPAYRKRRPLDC